MLSSQIDLVLFIFTLIPELSAKNRIDSDRDLPIAAGMKQGLEEKTKKFVENGGEIYKSFNPLPRNPMSSGWHRTGSQCACNAVLESTVTARCANE